jgi:hypothetical protein
VLLTLNQVKNMKNALLTLCISVIFLDSGCRKGDGDPFISLQSRKTRVAGNWNCLSFHEEAVTTNTPSSSPPSSVTRDMTDGKISVTTDAATAASYTADYFMKLNFGKNGFFHRTIGETNISGNGIPPGRTILDEATGTWGFLEDLERTYKNKERVIINITSRVKTYMSASGSMDVSSWKYTNGMFTEVWTLETLRNRKVVVKGRTDKSYSDVDVASPTQQYASETSGSFTATYVQ